MLFNSLSFAFFLPVVFILYWFATEKSLKIQNLLLLVASCFFYACWNYKFLFLLLFSTLIGFSFALKIHNSSKTNIRKSWLWLYLAVNLGLLGVFKYYNFFASSFASAVTSLGFHADLWTLHVILPVGISFYTFHGLSYVIDVYKKRADPTRNFIEYAVFVSFFPLLVAGPIERATHLLPQIQHERQFDYSEAVDGLKQILWGLFKKIVIADGCAEYVNLIFDNSTHYPGSTLALGVIFFSFQIYCDFSGYSDIAIGTGKLFGIELFQNFAFPYFSRNISEFWRRWHISLSTWFRDYVFFPLERRRFKLLGQPLNILVVFFLTGLWHGANWTFIIWGLLHGSYLILFSAVGRIGIYPTQVSRPSYISIFFIFIETLLTFLLVSFAWIFFRAKDVGHAVNYITALFSSSIIKVPELPEKSWGTIAFICIFLVTEWLGRNQGYAIAHLGLNWPRPLRWALYYIIIAIIFYYAGSEQQFIYFQF